MKSPRPSTLFLLACLSIAGCSSSSEGAAPSEDATADANGDASGDAIGETGGDATADAAPEAAPDAATDAGDTLEAASDAPAESGPDAPSSCDGGVPGPFDGGACHALTFTAAEVPITTAGSLPTMTGGAIALGTYDAIEAKTTGSLTGAYRAVWRFSDCALDVYEYVTTGSGTPPTPTPRTLTWGTAGTTLTRTQVCGGTTSFTNDYTARSDASGTFLDVRSGQLMFTFKKR